jgi:uncharacterized membrane protein YtjA (UPF0391 family)
MSKWEFVLTIVCVLAAALGLGGVAVITADTTRLLFCVFLVMFVAVLLIALLDTGTNDRKR